MTRGSFGPVHRSRLHAGGWLVLACLLLSGCNTFGGELPGTMQVSDTETVTDHETVSETLRDERPGDTTEDCGLVLKGRIPLEHATLFRIDAYEGGYLMVTVDGGTRLLSVPEGAEIPRGLEDDIIVFQQPADHIYLAASAAADMLDAIGALGSVRYSATDIQNWHVEGIREAMEKGEIVYSGKYSTPDYELLTADGCRLAVENMMITHTPEVIGKLEELDIPVIIDHASYEKDPLGRLEWVKFYGALTGHLEEADAAYEAQVAQTRDLPDTGKTVAFFYLRQDGSAVVRRSDDYIPAMIRLAGGEYILGGLNGEDHQSTTSMQFEAFYAAAKDADYIIYNGTTSGEIHSIQELLGKSELLADFPAVQEGRVYAVSQDMYQNTMSLGTIVADLHRMMTDAPDPEMVYLEHLY